MSFAITAAVVSVGTAAYSISSSRKMAKKQEALGREEAAMEKEVTVERIRQIGREESMMREETVAATAASGVKIGSQSTLEVLAEQKAEFARERAITEKVGASRAAAALGNASLRSQTTKYQGYSAAASGITNAFSLLHMSGKF